jgi:hypothetical protein
MTTTKADTKPSPIEVWLRRAENEMNIICTAVQPDESTKDYGVTSLSMRGAEREMTGWFIEQGYTPVGRWQVEYQDRDEPVEVVRTFRIG